MIANDEPYFKVAYSMIRAEEMAKGTWTDYDERAFRNRLAEARFISQPSDIASERLLGAPCDEAMAWALTESSESTEAVYSKTLAAEILELNKYIASLKGELSASKKQLESVLYLVAERVPGETRLQTAMRIITEHENRDCEGGTQEEA